MGGSGLHEVWSFRSFDPLRDTAESTLVEYGLEGAREGGREPSTEGGRDAAIEGARDALEDGSSDCMEYPLRLMRPDRLIGVGPLRSSTSINGSMAY